MLEVGEVHGGKFMMEEGRFMLEKEVHDGGGEVHGGKFMLEGEDHVAEGYVHDGGGEVHVGGVS